VAPADYQCLDFDKGMPSANVWVPNVQGGGLLELTTGQVRSVPNALRAAVWYGVDAADLRWQSSGSLISSVTASTEAYFLETYGGGGHVDHLCVTIGGTKACLTYRYGELGTPFTITFPSLLPPRPFCEVNFSIDYSKWVRLELTLSNDGVATVSANGSSMTCASGTSLSSGAAAVQVGAECIDEGDWADIHVDNFTAFVRR
jgi:hypothetical protein